MATIKRTAIKLMQHSIYSKLEKEANAFLEEIAKSIKGVTVKNIEFTPGFNTSKVFITYEWFEQVDGIGNI